MFLRALRNQFTFTFACLHLQILFYILYMKSLNTMQLIIFRNRTLTKQYSHLFKPKVYYKWQHQKLQVTLMCRESRQSWDIIEWNEHHSKLGLRTSTAGKAGRMAWATLLPGASALLSNDFAHV